MGYLRTTLLLAALTALFMGIGYLLGGMGGALIALLVAFGMNMLAYWNSDKMVLRMHDARPADRQSAPELFSIVEQLAKRADLPMPKVYIIDNPQPNAFATGRNPANAAVAATTGLLHACTTEEVAGVMAHELAHVRNRDTLIMTITATIAGAISMLASFAMFFGNSRDNNNPLGLVGALLLAVLAPIAATIVQLAISRSREYEADRIGAEICGQPLWLASALDKLQHASQRIDNRTAEDNPATAHLFIVNPLHARAIDGLFSTHPNMGNRISRLQAMARSPEFTATAGVSAARPAQQNPWGNRPDNPARGQRRGARRGPWG